jgi:parallel beta-helix repeat protein
MGGRVKKGYFVIGICMVFLVLALVHGNNITDGLRNLTDISNPLLGSTLITDKANYIVNETVLITLEVPNKTITSLTINESNSPFAPIMNNTGGFVYAYTTTIPGVYTALASLLLSDYSMILATTFSILPPSGNITAPEEYNKTLPPPNETVSLNLTNQTVVEDITKEQPPEEAESSPQEEPAIPFILLEASLYLDKEIIYPNETVLITLEADGLITSNLLITCPEGEFHPIDDNQGGFTYSFSSNIPGLYNIQSLLEYTNKSLILSTQFRVLKPERPENLTNKTIHPVNETPINEIIEQPQNLTTPQFYLRDRGGIPFGSYEYSIRADGRMDLEVSSLSDTVIPKLMATEVVSPEARAVIRGISTPSPNLTIKMDSIQQKDITTLVFAMDELEIENATITLPKLGKVDEIVHCPGFDLREFVCPEWETTDIPFSDNGDTITFVVDSLSAYAGAEIDIINVQSYPTVGGNWTVGFTTIGKANLTVTAIDGTAWSNVNEDNDLKFLEIRCGDEALDYKWVDGSVFIENYECNKTGYEISRVLTPGKHTLEFRFGYDVKYAYNTAGQDFKIQRGYAIILSGQISVTITAGADYVAPTGEAFIRIVNTRLTGMGKTSGGTSTTWDDADSWSAYIMNPSNLGTSIKFNRHSTDTWDDRISWEIIEYIGPSGGVNEIKVRGVGNVTYATAGTTVNTSAISGISDDNDVVAFITGQASPETTAATGSLWSTSEWLSASDKARFTRGDTGTDATDISYAVVEFAGANWKVQRTQHQFIAAGSWEYEGLTTAVESVSKAFIHTQHRAVMASPGLDEAGEEAYLYNTTHLALQLQTGATTPSNFYCVAWVIEHNNTNSSAMEVQHIGGSRATGGSEEDTWTESITSVSALNRTSIFCENGRSAGTAATNYPRGSINLQLSTTSSVELKQADTAQAQNYRFCAVEWPTVENTTTTPTITWTWANINTTTSTDTTNVTLTLDKVGGTCNLTVSGTLYEMEGSGTSWWQNLTNFANGNYTVWANCSDRYGNIGNSTVAWWRVVITYPNISFVGPTPPNATTTSDQNVTINVSITEADLEEVVYNWNGVNYTMYNDSLVLMYNFENVSALGESNTHVVDVSKYENNGTITGAGVSGVNGVYGKAYYFYNTPGAEDSWISVPDSGSLTLTNITLSAWVRMNESTAYQTVLSSYNDDAPYDYYELAYNFNSIYPGKGVFAIRDSGSAVDKVVTTNVNINDGQWHHLAGVRDAKNTLFIYLDGVLSNTADDTTTLDEIDPENGIPWIGLMYNCTIDEIRLWNRTLTAAEINQSYMSNLYKYDTDKWALFVNQTKNSTDGLDYGTYTYQAFAMATNDNQNQTEERTITIQGPLIITWTWTDINSTTSATTNVTLSLNNNGQECNLTVNGTVYNMSGSGTSWWQNLTNFAGGNYTLWANCSDTNGDLANSTTAWWKADTSIPLISFVGPTPPNATTTSDTNVTINVSVTESNLEEVVYNWNGVNYTVYNDSLVLMYNFDNVSALGEDNTHVKDASSYGNDGTVSGGNKTTANGKFNRAMQFNGNGDYVTISDNAAFTVTDFTISAWIKFPTCTAYGNILSAYNGEVQKATYGLDVDSTGTFSLEVREEDLTYDSVTATHDSDDNNWHHVVAVRDEGSTLKIYIDGVEDISEGDSTSGSINPSAGFRISDNPAHEGNYIEGVFDEIRLWNRTLSAAEVNQSYMSNLRKYDTDKWALFVNQTKNSTDGLDYGTYTYQAFATDTSDNQNQTEERTITILPCGSTITSDTTLTQDMECTGDGLIFGANSITLDCAGHTIKGDNSGDDIGVNVSSYDNAVIKDCYISDFALYGIYFSGSDDSWAYNNTVDDPTCGINITNSDHVKIENSTVNNNTYGICAHNSLNLTVRNNTVYNNSFMGVYFKYTNQSRIQGNTIRGNSTVMEYLYGIYLSNSNLTEINENTIELNETTAGPVFYGIYIVVGPGITAGGNDITNNTIELNTTTETIFGVVLSNEGTTNSNTVRNNTFDISGVGYGIYFYQDGTASMDSNTFRDNRFDMSGGDDIGCGLEIRTDSAGTANYIRIINNTINMEGGVHFVGVGMENYGTSSAPMDYATVSNNTINMEGELNVGLAFGSSIGGGNPSISHSMIRNNTLNIDSLYIAVGIYLTTDDTLGSSIFNNTIKDNTMEVATSEPGDVFGCYGLYIGGANLTNVGSNTVNVSAPNAYAVGVYMDNSATDNDVQNNTIRAGGTDGDYGVYLNNSNLNTFVNNSVRSYGDDALYITNNSDLNIFRNSTFVSGSGLGDYGVYLYTEASKNNMFTNCSIFGGSGEDVYLSAAASTNNTFLNCSYDSEYVGSGAELIRQWYIRVNVADSYNGDPLKANITFENSTGVKIGGNQTSDETTGLTPWVNLTQYKNVSGTEVVWTPYTINVTKTNYATASESHSFTSNKVINITLAAINQYLSNCANLDQGNVTYWLTQSVSSAGTCFNITANNVTLKCEGNTITYSQSTAGSGVNITGYHNATVRDCIITQGSGTTYSYGVKVKNSRDNAVRNNTITTAGATGSSTYNYGVYLENSDRSVLGNNSITTVSRYCYGIYLYSNSGNNTLANNSITTSRNYGYGIHLSTNSNSNTIRNNSIATSNERSWGIYLLSNSNNNAISNNTVKTSDTANWYSYAVYISSSSYNTLANNTVMTTGSNWNYGILVSSGPNTTIRNNTVITSGDTSYGIYLASSSTCNLTDNKVSTSRTSSYVIDGSSLSHFAHTLKGDNLAEGLPVNYTYNVNDQVYDGVDYTSYGQVIFGYASNITVRNCEFQNDSLGLFYVKNSTLDDNIMWTSKGHGIHLHGSSTTNNTLANSSIITKGQYNHAIYLVSTSDNTVRNNTISTTADYANGIKMESSSRNTLLNNTITTSGAWRNYGIYSYASSNSNLIGSSTITTSGTYSYGVYLYTSPSHNKFYDTSFSSSSAQEVVLSGASINNTFLNCTYGSEIVGSGGSLYRQWYITVNVTDGTDPLETDVTIENKTGKLLDSDTTSATTGLSKRFNVTRYVNLSGIVTYWTNITVNVTKTYYDDVSDSHNFTSNKVINITTSDTTNPTITWTWADINSTTKYATTNVTITTSEPANECNLTVNGTMYNMSGSDTSWWQNLTNFASGNYTIWVNCSDQNGNVGNSTIAWWKIDKCSGIEPFYGQDWIIADTTICHDTEITIGSDKDVTVQNGGRLVLDNVTLVFVMAVDGAADFTIQSGGGLTIDNSSNISSTSATYDWDLIVQDAVTLRSSRFEDLNANGVDLQSTSDNSNITGCTFYDGVTAILMTGADNIRVENCSFGTFTATGIRIISSSSDNIIEGNNITIAGDGIYILSSSHDNTVTHNNVTCTGSYHGLELDSSNNTFSYNNFSGSTSYTVYLTSNSYNNTFYENYVEHTGAQEALYLTYSDSNNFTSNTFNASSDYAVYLEYSASNLFKSNMIKGTSAGVYLRYSSTKYNNFTSNNITGTAIGVFFNPTYSNTFSSNTIKATSGAALDIRSSSENNTFEHNIIKSSSTGISINAGSNNTFSYNNITGTTAILAQGSPNKRNNFDHNNITATTQDAFYLISNSRYYLSIADNITAGAGSGDYGADIEGSSSHNKFVDAIISSGGSAADVYLSAAANVNNTFLNCTYDSETVGAGASLYRQWYITVNVTNSSNGAALKANVSIENKTGEFVDNDTTSETTGLSKKFNVTQYKNLAGTKTYWTNITVNATKSGYADVSESHNFTDNKVINISMIEVSNTAPIVDSFQATDPIDLGEGVGIKAWCNATITDEDGWEDVDEANATLFISPATHTSADDPDNHYTNSSCTLEAGSGTSRGVNCAFYPQWYADDGEWKCNITANDSSGASGWGNKTDITVNTLVALVVNASLAFEDLDIGETSTDHTLQINNTGNTGIDVTVNGSDLDCTGPADNISVGQLHYNESSEAAYADMCALTSTSTDTCGALQGSFDLADGVAESKSTYWKLQIPTRTGGTCTGSMTVEAIQSV